MRNENIRIMNKRFAMITMPVMITNAFNDKNACNDHDAYNDYDTWKNEMRNA